jgi:hypothetical protein
MLKFKIEIQDFEEDFKEEEKERKRKKLET